MDEMPLYQKLNDHAAPKFHMEGVPLPDHHTPGRVTEGLPVDGLVSTARAHTEIPNLVF